MKLFCTAITLFFFFSCGHSQQIVYTGCTPAAPVVRSFLGIPLKDSVDFIRWNLRLSNNQFNLQCHYGIGKPNTNGFINGGKTVELAGSLVKNMGCVELRSADKTLRLAVLNSNLLHVTDLQSNLLVGNGGWSYTLNKVDPMPSDQFELTTKEISLKDSVAFHGRTPCGVPGIVKPGRPCNKLKWLLVLYVPSAGNTQGTYRVFGTAWRAKGGLKGYWKIVKGENGRTIYQLLDAQGNGFISLLRLDDHLLTFTDAQGNLLVGDSDFSYTLNRRW